MKIKNKAIKIYKNIAFIYSTNAEKTFFCYFKNFSVNLKKK